MQALEIVDTLVVVYGDKNDKILIDTLPPEIKGRIIAEYLEWPQPEWSYEELPKHLNLALAIAYSERPDWIIKFDVDYFIHEQDRDKLREILAKQKLMRVEVATLEKLQFFNSKMCYEKGPIQIALNADFNIRYGHDRTRYTDLCQPIIPERTSTMVNVNFKNKAFDIPSGRQITNIERTGIHVWNYDYTFKTEPKAMELLYHFDRSHAKFWGSGYSGKNIDSITPESAFNDYMMLVAGRMNKCTKRLGWTYHPKHIQQRIKEIKTNEFGYSLWDKIEYKDDKWQIRK